MFTLGVLGGLGVLFAVAPFPLVAFFILVPGQIYARTDKGCLHCCFFYGILPLIALAVALAFWVTSL